MPKGHHDHNHGAGGGAATAAYPQTSSPPKGCGCAPPETSTCCDLVCFERPRYFCGHLLKDTDLSKAQEYVLEKHKLYHRTLHGHGVVCGLRLTCDGACCGNIRIDEGYAIDDCGNDIVVCERQPFDVIARLKAKGLLIPTVFKDPCDEETETTPCAVRQCFYIVVCYQETEHDFTTPLTPGCGPSPKDCEATRIRESYTFDVVDTLPPAVSPLDSLKGHLEHCFKLFADSPFGKSLEEVRRLLCPGTVTNSDGVVETAPPTMAYEDQHKLFCRVRGLFLLYLKQHPDEYNCRLEQEVLDLGFPTANEATTTGTVDKAFCRLIELAYGYSLSCFFGELAFPCPEPSRASCVVLGTVEVEDGCVVRVCNCPRKYVWSFASFFQVLFASLVGSGPAKARDDRRYRRPTMPPVVPHEHTSDHEAKAAAGAFEIDDCCAFLEAMAKSGKERRRSGLGAAQRCLVGAHRCNTRSTRHAGPPCSLRVHEPDLGTAERPQDGGESRIRVLQPSAITDPLESLARSFLPDEHTRYAIEFDKNGRVIAAQPVPELWARMAAVERQVSRAQGADLPDPGEEQQGQAEQAQRRPDVSSQIDRVHFYERQYLRAFDLEAEQAYHLQMRRRLNLALHLWGIVDGFNVAKGELVPGRPTSSSSAPAWPSTASAAKSSRRPRMGYRTMICTGTGSWWRANTGFL